MVRVARAVPGRVSGATSGADDTVAAAELSGARLLPGASGVSAADVGLVADPGVEGRSLLAKARGALSGGAIGDALGRPAEGRSRKRVRDLFPDGLRDFQPRGDAGPRGTITDDTQLTIVVAECLVEQGRIVGGDLAERLVAWLPEGRGVGHTCRTAVERLEAGVPWHLAGIDSAGNGASMRVAPVGIARRSDLDRLREDAALSAVVTHRHPMAVAGAIAQAFATAWCLQRAPGRLDPYEFLHAAGLALADVHDPGEYERRLEAGDEPVTLATRISELGDLLDLEPDRAIDRLWNGAFVLESLPAAWWCFLHSPDDPERVIVTAAEQGHDADTVAALAGTLAGAYCGVEKLPARWRDGLEVADRVEALAEALLGA